MNARIRTRTRTTATFLWNSAHEITHLILGFLFYYFIVLSFFPEMKSDKSILFLSLLGSLLPDVDHFFYFFLYGRKKEYTVLLKSVLHEEGWREVAKFFRKNHKEQTGLVSHNLLTVATLGIVTYFSFTDHRVMTFTLLGAMMTHFLMDILDDWIYLGGLNPNWYLRFGRDARPRKNRKQAIIKKLI
jgi:membrane-bound metal-dependent hydrolase YbcI (DUF457 family)